MFEHAEQASSRGVLEGGGGGATGLLNEGGGSNRLPALNKLWNFHRYILVHSLIQWTLTNSNLKPH